MQARAELERQIHEKIQSTRMHIKLTLRSRVAGKSNWRKVWKLLETFGLENKHQNHERIL